MITTISFYLALIFYAPAIAIAAFYHKIGRLLFIISLRSTGLPSGYKAKIGLKLISHAYKIINETSMDVLSYTLQIKEKEKIMKAIQADKAYDYIVKDDRKKKPEERTVFKMKFLDPFTSARLGDQIYDVQGIGAKRKERFLTGTQQLEILKECLCGWENFEAPDSTEEHKKLVEFNAKKIEEMISMISPRYRAELADFARGESELDEGEEQS